MWKHENSEGEEVTGEGGPLLGHSPDGVLMWKSENSERVEVRRRWAAG